MRGTYFYTPKNLVFQRKAKVGKSVSVGMSKKNSHFMRAKNTLIQKDDTKKNLRKLVLMRKRKLFKLAKKNVRDRVIKNQEEDDKRAITEENRIVSNKIKFCDFMSYVAKVERDRTLDKLDQTRDRIMKRIKRIRSEANLSKNIKNYIVSEVVKDCRQRIFGHKALDMVKAQDYLAPLKGSSLSFNAPSKIIAELDKEEERIRFNKIKHLIYKPRKHRTSKSMSEPITEDSFHDLVISLQDKYYVSKINRIRKKMRRKKQRDRINNLEEMDVKRVMSQIPKLHSRINSVGYKNKSNNFDSADLHNDQYRREYYEFLRSKNKENHPSEGSSSEDLSEQQFSKSRSIHRPSKLNLNPQIVKAKKLLKNYSVDLNKSLSPNASFSGISPLVGPQPLHRRRNQSQSITSFSPNSKFFGFKRQNTEANKSIFLPVPEENLNFKSSSKQDRILGTEKKGDRIIKSKDISLNYPSITFPITQFRSSESKQKRKLKIMFRKDTVGSRSIMEIREEMNESMTSKNKKLMKNKKYFEFFQQMSKVAS